MALSYLHGIETLELDDGLRPIQTVKSSVIGIIGTAPNADVDLFPLNTPVALFANPVKARELGREGTLLDSIDAIHSQGTAVIVVIRVAEGTSSTPETKAAETWSNAIGSPSAKTGVWALLKARPVLRVIPKILLAPGLTADRPVNGVSDAVIGAGGAGYVQSTTTITFSTPPAGGQTARGTAQIVGGALTGITITDPGFGYASAPTVTITGAGTGATATATMGAVANPVAVALGAVAQRLRAMAIVDGPGTTYNAAVSYRGDFGSQRVVIVDPGVLVWDTVTSTYVTKPASPYAAGIQARLDTEKGFWFPFSNVPIENIGGPARPVDFMVNDEDSEANQLNANEVTTIIHDDGFRFWGLRSTSTDPLWAFYSVRRTADMIYESVERAHREVMDKPFSFQLLRTIVNSVNSYLRILRSRGALIGGTCWIDPTVNTPATFANGELIVDFDLEPPAPLEHLTFRTRRNTNYYEEFINDFASQVVQKGAGR